MVDAIEAKISPDAFTARSLKAFRQHHPKGDNLLISRIGGHLEPLVGRFQQVQPAISCPLAHRPGSGPPSPAA